MLTLPTPKKPAKPTHGLLRREYDTWSTSLRGSKIAKYTVLSVANIEVAAAISVSTQSALPPLPKNEDILKCALLTAKPS